MRLDGSIHHPAKGEPCEYCVVVSITNEKGEKLARQVVGVGALQPGERHRYSFSVEVIPARAAVSAPPARSGVGVSGARTGVGAGSVGGAGAPGGVRAPGSVGAPGSVNAPGGVGGPSGFGKR